MSNLGVYQFVILSITSSCFIHSQWETVLADKFRGIFSQSIREKMPAAAAEKKKTSSQGHVFDYSNPTRRDGIRQNDEQIQALAASWSSYRRPASQILSAASSFTLSSISSMTLRRFHITWGNPNDTIEISFHGSPHSITMNLDSALRHLRYSNRSRLLCVHALWINF